MMNPLPGDRDEDGDLLTQPLLNNHSSVNRLEQGLSPAPVRFSFDHTPWATIIANSVVHTASTPLALIVVFKGAMQNLKNRSPENAFAVLLGAWVAAALLSGWASYYKYARLKKSYDFSLLGKDTVPEPHNLYWLMVEGATNPGLHYVFDGEKDGEKVVDVKRVEHLLKSKKIKEFLLAGRAAELTPEELLKIKVVIAPQHKPGRLVDEKFIPGTRKDHWFIPLCALSQLPAMPSGAILGYSIKGIPGAVLFALLNYAKNLLTDTPAIANAYGINKALGNMAAVATLPLAWLIINSPVLWLLTDIGPGLLAAFTSDGLMTDTTISSPLGIILAVILFPFVVAAFLLFTITALQKLDLAQGLNDYPQSYFHKALFSKSAIEKSVDLEYMFAHSYNPLTQLTKILLNYYLQPSWCQKGWSPQSVAYLITAGKALGDLALVFGATFEVVKSFLTFFFDENAKAKASNMPISWSLIGVGLFAAIMGAISQMPNFNECAQTRKKMLDKETQNDTDKHLYAVVDTTPLRLVTNNEETSMLIQSNGVVKTMQDLLAAGTIKNGVFTVPSTLFYGTATAATTVNPSETYDM